MPKWVPTLPGTSSESEVNCQWASVPTVPVGESCPDRAGALVVSAL